MVTSLKRSQACIATVHALNSAAGHHQPMPSLETPGHPQACLEQSPVVTVPFSWVLVHKVLFVPSKSLLFQSYISSDSSIVGLMATSSKRTYAIPTPRASVPVTVHC